MEIEYLTESQYNTLFSDRSFNPPGERTEEIESQFGDEFGEIMELTHSYFEEFYSDVPKDSDFSYYIHESYNWSRVVDVLFSDNRFLDKKKIEALQLSLQKQLNNWTFIVWHDPFWCLFIDKNTVRTYINSPDEITTNKHKWILKDTNG